MNNALTKLLAVSSDALLPVWQGEEEKLLERFGVSPTTLLDLLRYKNGFFAFESALHVYPLGSRSGGLDLVDWNDPQEWRYEYGDLIGMPVLFFAQDAFGNQFGISNQNIVLFYSEFAEIEPVAKDLDEWSEVLMGDWRGLSGYELAHEWQVQNRPLTEGERLIPKVPFVVGGKYELSNLYAGRVAEAMRFRGSLAQQLATIPDGTPINLKITKG
jgi:hypothetical protein